jgi:hypothetical protein
MYEVLSLHSLCGCLPNGLLPLDFAGLTFVFISRPIRAICPSHFILTVYLLIQLIFGAYSC